MNKAHNNDKNTYFLATTAIEEFWDTSKPILFLGEWCRRYSRKSYWEPLDGEVIASPWQNTQELYSACDYVSAVYERFLPVIGEALNSILKVNHNNRYWRIVLGPWLLLYIHSIYDRYMCLRSALDRYPNLTTTVLARDNWIIPEDTLEFFQLLREDSYNLQIYSRILSALDKSLPEKVLNVVATPLDARKVNPSFTDRIKNTIGKKCIIAISNALKEGHSIIFRGSYFSPFIEMQLVLKTYGKVWPLYAGLPGLDALNLNKNAEVETNTDVRNNLYYLLLNDEFERLVSHLLPLDLPLCFIEGIEELQQTDKKIYPHASKAIFSSVSWYYDEAFKRWAAAASERGCLLMGMQHGGNYGSRRYDQNADHEIEITDRYFTWGWDRPDASNKVISWFASKLSGRDAVSADNGKHGILFVGTSWPRYLFQFPYTTNRHEEYLLWQSRFLVSMNTRLLPQLRVRLHREDCGWDVAQRLQDAFPKINAESWDITFQQSLNDCRIYVCDQLSTTFLEALSADRPTILFWDPEINELKKEAQPYYDLLRTVGILFDTPEAAAAAVSAVYDDVESWWNEPERQKARKSFCRRFARTSSNSVDEWTKEFARISRVGISTHE